MTCRPVAFVAAIIFLHMYSSSRNSNSTEREFDVIKLSHPHRRPPFHVALQMCGFALIRFDVHINDGALSPRIVLSWTLLGLISIDVGIDLIDNLLR